MASLNRVDLIGVVATAIQRAGDSVGFVLLTERSNGRGVERHRAVVGPRATIEPLHVGDAAYLEGHLERQRGRTVVVVRHGFRLEPGPPIVTTQPAAQGTHRSPAAHERRGHLRHVAAGTPRERLIWVRAASVGGRAPTER